MPTWSAEHKQSVPAADAVVLQEVEAGYEPGIPVIKLPPSWKTCPCSRCCEADGLRR
jgi:hypothetical protein